MVHNKTDYFNNAVGRTAKRNADRKYQKTDKGKLVRKQAMKKYRISAKGKLADSKHKTKRKRNLNWIKMFDNPFDDLELIDWHHINDVYVVALPRDLHKQYLGKYHREKTMKIVKQIYLGDRI